MNKQLTLTLRRPLSDEEAQRRWLQQESVSLVHPGDTEPPKDLREEEEEAS